MSIGEYEHEPLRGLPEYLPRGEALVWQGAPEWRSMALRVFHARTVAIYFGLIVAVHLGSQLSSGVPASTALLAAGWQLGLGLAAIAILTGLAWAYARSTVYTLTSERLVLRFGVALPMMINIPLKTVLAADLRGYSDGTGDIVLTVAPKHRLSYMVLWPNLRPWRFRPVQPALRSVADVQKVAAALARVVDETPPSAETQPASATLAGAS